MNTKSMTRIMAVFVCIMCLAMVVIPSGGFAAQYKAHYKVAWIPPDMFNPFWTYNRQGMEEVCAEAAANGIKVDIVQLAPVKTFNVEEQVAIFENAIQMKVDAIIICPTDQQSVVPCAEKAKAAGIPVVALSTDIPSPSLLSFVGVENKESSDLIGEHVIKSLGGKGDFIILSGIPGNLVSEDREAGYKQALARHPECKLLSVQPAYFNRADGMATMENMLTRFRKIDAVLCINDEIALGAYEAVLAAGREKEILICGFDGNRDTIESIRDGKIGCTLDQGPWRQGSDSLRTLLRFWDGESIPRYQTWLGGIITKQNAAGALKNFAEMEIWFKP